MLTGVCTPTILGTHGCRCRRPICVRLSIADGHVKGAELVAANADLLMRRTTRAAGEALATCLRESRLALPQHIQAPFYIRLSASLEWTGGLNTVRCCELLYSHSVRERRGAAALRPLRIPSTLRRPCPLSASRTTRSDSFQA